MPDSGMLDRLHDLSKFNFPVKEVDVHYDAGGIDYKTAPNHKAIIREDTGAILGIHTKAYKLTPYRDPMVRLNQMIVDSGLDLGDLKVDDQIHANGARIHRIVSFRKVLIEPRIGDTVCFTLRITDSYDGSNQFSYGGGTERLWCLNKATVPGVSIKFACRHATNHQEGRSLQLIGKMLENFHNSEVIMRRWGEMPVKRDNVEMLFKNTLAKRDDPENPLAYNKKRFEDLMPRYDHNAQQLGETAYTVWNTATNWATYAQTPQGEGHTARGLKESWDRTLEVDRMLESPHWTEALAA